MTARKTTHSVTIGSVSVGGDAPVVVQSMTNTDTADVIRTAIQISELAAAGSEIVRVTVNNEASAKAIPDILDHMDKLGCHVPVVGDFHYNGHKLLSKYSECAAGLAKYRINPGNVGLGKKRSSQFADMIDIACQYEKPVRIGVNWGSLDQDLLASMLDQNASAKKPLDIPIITRKAVIESALKSAAAAESIGLPADKIVLSCKMSDVQELIAVYSELSSRCAYALHLGLTEAGMGVKGIVASTAALSVLLQQGIGDTIRISLTPEPGGSRTQEVKVAQALLQSLGLRSFTPSVIACPGCGRTTSEYFQVLAADIQAYLHQQMPVWKSRYPGVETMNVAVMGCVVNGPGESKMANIGISLPGNGERPVAPVYIDGKKDVTLKGDHIAEEFQTLVDTYVKTHYTPA